MKRFFILIAFALLLSACAKKDALPSEEQSNPPVTQAQRESQTDPIPTQAQDVVPETPYEFHDAAIKDCIERYFDKSADALTTEDFETLSKLQSFSFDAYGKNVTTLLDLPDLFPELRYVSLAFSWFDEARLSMIDCEILEEMDSLRAVDIYADGLPSLDFVEKLPYVSLRYTEEAYLSDEYNLAEASVLGKKFIGDQVTGHVKEYVKVADGERVYELIVTDFEQADNDEIWDSWYEAKILISEKRNGEYYFLNSLDVPGRIGNVSGGLILADANFDGLKDILISQGHFGAQGLVTYACFLNYDGTYKLCESFSEIPNPALDEQNKKVLSTWRNWAASHSWAMYSYIDGEFIETDRLTQEPEETGEHSEENNGAEIWKHEVEHISAENTELEIYLTSEYTDDEWIAMFYDESSFWGLYSDKWWTLFNQGTLLDWSLYGDGLDAQIMEIIGG